MIKRLLFLLAGAAVLAVALVASQQRREPLKVSGFIEADEIRLGSRVGGRVLHVHVEEGSAVRAGEVLVELEPFDLTEKLHEATALVAQRQAKYDELQAGNRPEVIAQAKARRDQLAAHLDKLVAGPRKQEIAAAAAEVDLAQAELLLADQKYERTKALHEMGTVPREAFDEATSQLKVMEARLVARKQQLALLEEGTREEDKRQAQAELEEAEQAWRMAERGYREQEIAEALAGLQAAQAGQAAVERQRKELRIVAPLDGVLETCELQPGDLVGANGPALAMLDLSHPWVRAYVPEDELDLKLGQTVYVTVDSYPQRNFRGEIIYVSRQAEFTPGNVQTPEDRSQQVFRIKVALDDPERLLRPGMAADVWLEGPPGQPPAATSAAAGAP